MYLTNKFKRNPTQANQDALVKEIEAIRYFDGVFGKIKEQANLTGTIATTTNFDCYKKAIKNFEAQCGAPNTYA